MGIIHSHQNYRLLSLYAFLGGCLWVAIGVFTFLVRREDVLAPFTNFEYYETTTGEIIVSTVVYKSGLGGSWHFEIDYQYTVAGDNYVSNKVHFIRTGESSSDQYARNYVEKYPVGSTVTVYYDPDKPAKSVLEPSQKSSSSLWLLGSFTGISILFFVLSISFIFRTR